MIEYNLGFPYAFELVGRAVEQSLESVLDPNELLKVALPRNGFSQLQ